MYNIDCQEPDNRSKLEKVYEFLRENPYATIVPDDYMPLYCQVYYVYDLVKNLRDGTDYPELTLDELQDIMNEEQPNWRTEKPELPDWFLEKHDIEKPIMKTEN